jgi:TonB family protein
MMKIGLLAAIIICTAVPSWAFHEKQDAKPVNDVVTARKTFVRELDKDILQARVKKIYVSDFTDESGKFSFLGRFFAATFAQLLDEGAMGFTVIDRAQVRRSLSNAGQADRQPADPDALAKVISDMDADAIVSGTIALNGNAATLNVVMRTPSGKDLAKLSYNENLNSVLRADLEASQSGSIFYTAGLDGVSLPNCVQCPAPDWPTGQGSPGRDGNVVLSILVTTAGNAAQMRVAESLDPVFDKAAFECVRSWVFEPAQDADGNPVPVRLPVQVTFKRNWQLR